MKVSDEPRKRRSCEPPLSRVMSCCMDRGEEEKRWFLNKTAQKARPQRFRKVCRPEWSDQKHEGTTKQNHGQEVSRTSSKGRPFFQQSTVPHPGTAVIVTKANRRRTITTKQGLITYKKYIWKTKSRLGSPKNKKLVKSLQIFHTLRFSIWCQE